MGFIPWDGITVGKDRIPWEKDRQSVLFYAPAPNFSQLCQFSSDFDVSYHFGIRRQNQKHWDEFKTIL